jgi:UDP-N-acetylglucosamine diphosphorylase/glucosamine-1-phosphate N-acetyltransferase
MKVVIFEDDSWDRFLPLSLTRHISLLMVGSASILEHIKRIMKIDEVALSGREHLAETMEERTELEYNAEADQDVLLINGRIKPRSDVIRLAKKEKGFVLRSRGEVVFAKVSRSQYLEIISKKEGLNKLSKSLESLETEGNLLFSYPWELVEENASYIAPVSKNKAPNLPELTGLKGAESNLIISPRAKIEEFVYFDATNGPIVIEDGTVIEPFSHLSGPCYIGRRCRIHSAVIRKNTTICEDCRVGGEVESSIIYPYTNKSHFGYVGHSIVGEWVNLGAGSVFSDLKNTYGTVKVNFYDKRLDTKLLKLGSFVGDMAKISIGCTIFAGKRLGVSSHVMGQIGDDVPDFTFYDGSSSRAVELDLESVIKTQRRMMARRGVEMSIRRKRLIEYLHKSSDDERKRRRVLKGKI